MTKSKYKNFDQDEFLKHVKKVIAFNKKYHTFLDPSLAEGRKTHNVKINLTDKEYDYLVQICNEMKMKKSEYFRKLMYYHGFVPTIKFDEVGKYDELVIKVSKFIEELESNSESINNVGSNFNQLLHRLNTYDSFNANDKKRLVEYLNALGNLVKTSVSINYQADDALTNLWDSLMGGVNDGLDESKSQNKLNK